MNASFHVNAIESPVATNGRYCWPRQLARRPLVALDRSIAAYSVHSVYVKPKMLHR